MVCEIFTSHKFHFQKEHVENTWPEQGFKNTNKHTNAKTGLTL